MSKRSREDFINSSDDCDVDHDSHNTESSSSSGQQQHNPLICSSSRNQSSSSDLFSDDVCFEILSFLNPRTTTAPVKSETIIGQSNNNDRSTWFMLKNCTLVSKQWLRVIGERLKKLHLCFGRAIENETSFRNSQFLPAVESVKVLPYSLRDNLQFVKQLSLLKNLTLLDIGYNGITVEQMQVIGGSSDLQHSLTFLDCSWNLLYEAAATSIGQLKQLKSLNVSGNAIRGGEATKSIASGLSNLTFLDVGSNSTGDEGAKQLDQLQQLTWLIASDNGIGNAGVVSIGKLKHLTVLDLSNNQISGVEGAKSIGNLKQLTILDLCCNEIGDAGVKCLGQSLLGHSLTLLNVSENEIGNEGAHSISKLFKQLTSLDITCNLIPSGCEGERSIQVEMKQLTFLDISHQRCY